MWGDGMDREWQRNFELPEPGIFDVLGRIF